MSYSLRFLRALSTLVMGAGIGAVAIGGLDLARDSLIGPFSRVIPNVSLPPAAVLGGLAMVIAGAALRRRVTRRIGIAAPAAPARLR